MHLMAKMYARLLLLEVVKFPGNQVITFKWAVEMSPVCGHAVGAGMPLYLGDLKCTQSM